MYLNRSLTISISHTETARNWISKQNQTISRILEDLTLWPRLGCQRLDSEVLSGGETGEQCPGHRWGGSEERVHRECSASSTQPGAAGFVSLVWKWHCMQTADQSYPWGPPPPFPSSTNTPSTSAIPLCSAHIWTCSPPTLPLPAPSATVFPTLVLSNTLCLLPGNPRYSSADQLRLLHIFPDPAHMSPLKWMKPFPALPAIFVFLVAWGHRMVGSSKKHGERELAHFGHGT